MEAEARIIIAFLFKRSGKTRLTKAELYLPLAMELGWFSTKEAQEFVTYSMTHGLLAEKEEALQPTFAIETIVIPVGFTPSKGLFHQQHGAEQKGNILERIIVRICSQSPQSQNEVLEQIRKEEKEKNLLPEIAAMYVARKHHVDISEFYKDVENIVF